MIVEHHKSQMSRLQQSTNMTVSEKGGSV
uniref:Uncharacterized protein n=1 Tax=Anguilla anguilla TaxID=7936 RepID=A0A0E9XDP4_ANGAN